MKIFVSWSKEPAKSIAVELKHFLEMTLRTANVWVSESDIEKGKRWGPEIARELETADAGIVCVTPNNKLEPWLHFEAGALSKSLESSRIHPLCFEIAKNQLPPTLSQFQATEFDREDFLSLVIALNVSRKTDAPEQESGVRERFYRQWERFEESVAEALKKPSAVQAAETPSVGASEVAKPALSEGEVKILQLLATVHGDVPLSAIAHEIGLNHTRTQYYLDRLEKLDYVYSLYSSIDETSYALAEAGRAAAVENGWA